MEERLDRSVLESPDHVLAGRARLEPGVDLAPWLGVNDHPGLGLAVIVGQASPSSIVGMDLHREILLGVDKFHQQRELVSRSEGRSEQVFPVQLNEVAECRPGKRTVRHPADIEPMVGNLPALGILRALADRLAEHGLQPPPSPDQAFEDRLEPKWVERVDHDPFHFDPQDATFTSLLVPSHLRDCLSLPKKINPDSLREPHSLNRTRLAATFFVPLASRGRNG